MTNVVARPKAADIAARIVRAVGAAEEMAEKYPPEIPTELVAGLPATPEEWRKRYGFPAAQDDLTRLHCKDAGKWGHTFCGECPTHFAPRQFCGCPVEGVSRDA